MTKLLNEVTDQYLAYALSNEGQDESARYAQYLAAFQKIEKRKKNVQNLKMSTLK